MWSVPPIRRSLCLLSTSALIWLGACSADLAIPSGPCSGAGCLTATSPATAGELGRYAAVATCPDGRLAVASWDKASDHLVLGLEAPSGETDWITYAGEDGASAVGRWVDLACDPSGVVHGSFYDATGGRLLYARLTGAMDLTVEAVPRLKPSDDVGHHTSIATSPDGVVHVAYRNVSQRRLEHAVRDPSGQWHVAAVDSCAGESNCPQTEAEDFGEYASIALVGDTPKIAFYDRLRGDLKLAGFDQELGWETATLDGRDVLTDIDTGDVGRFLHMAVDSKLRVGIAYFDASRSVLRYAFPSGGEPMTVDGGVYVDEATGATRQHMVGQHVSLAYDAQGDALMVYLDASRLRMKMTRVRGVTLEPGQDLQGLEAGGWIDLSPTPDGAVRGVYGAWTRPSLSTSLVRFDVPLADQGTP